jgi:hypothetical protein
MNNNLDGGITIKVAKNATKSQREEAQLLKKTMEKIDHDYETETFESIKRKICLQAGIHYFGGLFIQHGPILGLKVDEFVKTKLFQTLLNRPPFYRVTLTSAITIQCYNKVVLDKDPEFVKYGTEECGFYNQFIASEYYQEWYRENRNIIKHSPELTKNNIAIDSSNNNNNNSANKRTKMSNTT